MHELKLKKKWIRGDNGSNFEPSQSFRAKKWAKSKFWHVMDISSCKLRETYQFKFLSLLKDFWSSTSCGTMLLKSCSGLNHESQKKSKILFESLDVSNCFWKKSLSASPNFGQVKRQRERPSTILQLLWPHVTSLSWFSDSFLMKNLRFSKFNHFIGDIRVWMKYLLWRSWDVNISNHWNLTSEDGF